MVPRVPKVLLVLVLPVLPAARAARGEALPPGVGLWVPLHLEGCSTAGAACSFGLVRTVGKP